MSDGFSGTDTIAAWLQPLSSDDGPCGPDLEYDNDFLALTQAAAGKPETQFQSAVPPDWRGARPQAEALMERTRDLRVAILWVRACTRLEGFAAVSPGLGLLHGLIDGFWETLHPLPDPDDGDPYARMNALGLLPDSEGLLGDIRQALLCTQRGVGELRVRGVELALGLAQPRDGETAFSRDQLDQILRGAVEQDPGLAAQPRAALDALKALAATVGERAGTAAPDFKPLQSLLFQLVEVMPAAAGDASGDGGDGADDSGGEAAGGSGAPAAAARRQGLSGTVASRDDALRAIDMVCEFLERTEPTSPAPMLLRRARKMINRNFLQLMKELAPDALPEVARVMGIDPDSVLLDDESAA